MTRDGMTEEEATDLFNEAKDALNEAIEEGNLSEAEEITYSYFNLEPDYLDDMLF